MQLVESHLILKKLPAEFGFIVNKGNLRNGVSLCGDLWAKPPRDRSRAVPQLLEEGWRDSKKVDACECLNLANLVGDPLELLRGKRIDTNIAE